jgi:hypothetical protein
MITLFLGDGITVTAAGAAGKVTFTASAKNTGSITTEFLLQKLKTKARTPTKNGYRSKGFSNFNAALTFDVPTVAGWYSVAYRFVNAATGQETEPILLGMLQVS